MKPHKIRTTNLPGFRNGLTVILDANIKDTGVSTGRSNGFKVSAHFFILANYFHFNLLKTYFNCVEKGTATQSS